MGYKLEKTSTKEPIALSIQSSLQEWRKELDGYYEEMMQFDQMEPGEIFRRISSFSARINYVRTLVVRNENRELANFRTKELEPFIQECSTQFKIWSRMLSSTQLEWETFGKE